MSFPDDTSRLDQMRRDLQNLQQALQRITGEIREANAQYDQVQAAIVSLHAHIRELGHYIVNVGPQTIEAARYKAVLKRLHDRRDLHSEAAKEAVWCHAEVRHLIQKVEKKIRREQSESIKATHARSKRPVVGDWATEGEE